MEFFNKINQKYDFKDCIYDHTFDYENLWRLCLKTNQKTLQKIIKCNNINDHKTFLIFILKIKKWGKGVKKEKFVDLYGEHYGNIFWNEYTNKQSFKNTFEYKKEKYGMTLEEFELFNKKRAITIENMIKKYGEFEGKERYDRYVKKQAYTNTIEYLGENRYKEVNEKKARTIENFISKYGEEGIEKFKEYVKKLSSNNYHSKISQDLFDSLMKEELFKNTNIYYHSLNKEFSIYSKDHKKIFFYDFVSLDLKIVIEFHGDHYHGNPKLYKPNDFLKGRGVTHMTACEKWSLDEKKNKAAKDHGFEVLEVWETDYRKDKKEVIERIKNYVNYKLR